MPPALSLVEACKRKVRRAELVEIYECLGFFWILEKGRIWSINVNLWDFTCRLCGWMIIGMSIDKIGMKFVTIVFLNPSAIMTDRVTEAVDIMQIWLRGSRHVDLLRD